MSFIRIRRPSLSPILALMAVALLCAPSASTQTTTGSIYGTAADSTSAVIPRVAITLTNVQTNATLTTETSTAGAYFFPVVDPGDY